jgi:hypothetical protein
MARYHWEELSEGDWALPHGEWAGVRYSTQAERRNASASRSEVCNMFLFRGCGYVLRLVVSDGSKQASLLKRMTMQRRIDLLLAKHMPDVPAPRSTIIFAAALQLCPDAIVEMNAEAQRTRCATCTCSLSDDGPLNRNSIQGRFARDQFMQAATAKQETR